MNWKGDGLTIFAPASGAGRAAIAVIRVSGPDAARAIERLAGPLPAPRFAAYRTLRGHDAEILDHALVLWFPGPNSFTGEDSAEFHVHGGRAVVKAVLAQLAGIEGLRPALPGEFARRAVVNGKMKLEAAEALADLIDSETEQQRRAALRSRDGEFGRQLSAWSQSLLEISAELESNIDFSDEDDVDSVRWDHITPELSQMASDMRRAIEGCERAEKLRNGLNVVLAGAPNVGKSSLLNALSKRDSAIISAIPGTTRDVIEVALEIDGYPVVLIDTAGLRETSDELEGEGIARTRKRLSQADLVLWLDDGFGFVDGMNFADTTVWRIATKLDMRPDVKEMDADLAISSVDGTNIEALLNRIGRFASECFHTDGSEVRVRHKTGLRDAMGRVALLADEAGDLPVEIAAEELRWARQALTELSTAMDTEAVFDLVFSRFCIGK